MHKRHSGAYCTLLGPGGANFLDSIALIHPGLLGTCGMAETKMDEVPLHVRGLLSHRSSLRLIFSPPPASRPALPIRRTRPVAPLSVRVSCNGAEFG